MKIQRLLGSLLLGICSTLTHNSLDIIINKIGEIKKKEENENKYRFIRKGEFLFGSDDVLVFNFTPFNQILRIENETKGCYIQLDNKEISDLG
jgi:hypothetical protein